MCVRACARARKKPILFYIDLYIRLLHDKKKHLKALSRSIMKLYLSNLIYIQAYIFTTRGRVMGDKSIALRAIYLGTMVIIRT